MRSWFRAALAAMLIVTFGGSAWATCVEGAIASDMQQMACCKAGHDHCPMEGNDSSDCCKISGPTFQSQPTTFIEPFNLVKPLPVTFAVFGVPALPVFQPLHSRVVFETSPPSVALGPPAYLAHSALLI